MAHREMMMRNLVTSLILYEKIITTAAKAKDLRSVADKMVTLAKRGDLHARRQAAEVLTDEKAVKKLFDSIGSRFQERSGGYTRITKLDYRMGDGAPLAAVEFLGAEAQVEAKGKAKAKGAAAPADEAKKPRRRRRRGKGKTAPGAESAAADATA
jgi:large subunit ribosomal protein L17